jgi:hypothetical protein
MQRNGVVEITRIYRKGQPATSRRTAHVHTYGTSVITNELEHPDFVAANCCIEITSKRIVFAFVEGPKKGRKFSFMTAGDSVGWDEMTHFAESLVADGILETM